MGFAVVHMQKIKANGMRGVQSHIYREHEPKTNPDVDMSKSDDNYALVNNPHLASAVKDTIKKLVTTGRAIRSDAVVMCSFIVTSDEKNMKAMSEEQQQAFFRDAVVWFQKRYGEKQVVSAVVHMDETTPHLHLGIVPIKDGRLTAKTIFTPKELREIQSGFVEDVASKYGLERGQEGSDRKHLSEIRYKLEVDKKALEQTEIALGKNLKEMEKAEEIIEPYKQLTVTAKDLRNKGKTIWPGYVLVGQKNFEILKEQASAYVVNKNEIANLREKSTRIQQMQDTLETLQEAATDNFRRAFDKYREQLQLNDNFEALQNENKELVGKIDELEALNGSLTAELDLKEQEYGEKENRLRGQIEAIESDSNEKVLVLQNQLAMLQSQFEQVEKKKDDEYAPQIISLKREIEDSRIALDTALANEKKGFDTLLQVVQAINMLLYSPEYKTGLSEKQQDLIQSLWAYAATVAVDTGKSELAKEMRSRYGISKEIRQKIEAWEKLKEYRRQQSRESPPQRRRHSRDDDFEL